MTASVTMSKADFFLDMSKISVSMSFVNGTRKTKCEIKEVIKNGDRRRKRIIESVQYSKGTFSPKQSTGVLPKRCKPIVMTTMAKGLSLFHKSHLLCRSNTYTETKDQTRQVFFFFFFFFYLLVPLGVLPNAVSADSLTKFSF